MNINELPQSNDSAEIYRLLKIGHYSILAEGQSFGIKTAQTQEVSKAKPSVIATTIAKAKPYTKWLFYPAIFAISFSIFYFSLNFPSLTSQIKSWFNNKSQAQTQLGENLAEYYKWINGYYYAIANKDLLAPNNDIDRDNATNLDEFIMRTNPTIADSDNDGINDGAELLNSTNPWGAGNMTSAQKKLKEQLDLSLISDRIGFAALASLNTQISESAKFDLNRPGKLSIPKLNVQVPLVWSKDPANFDKDLESGVIHYPGTALPGEQGVVYVSGHSSDLLWKQNQFSTVFTRINKLVAGDDIFVTVYEVDGNAKTYRYRVTGNKIYSPDDQTQFIDNSSAKLNLSTCWPIGTSKDRLVVSAELAGL